MLATDLISSEIMPIQTTDTGRAALLVMNDHYVKHLPVLKDDEYIGMISEDDLLDHSLDFPIEEIVQGDIKFSVFQSDHLFMVLSKMAELQLTVLPVLDEDRHYIGAIKQEEVLHYYLKNFSFIEPGSVLVMEMDKRDYSLSAISRVIESENAHILSSFLSKNQDAEKITLTLKLNILEVNNLKTNLERMGYKINASYQEAEYFNTLQERYDAFMHYLNM